MDNACIHHAEVIEDLVHGYGMSSDYLFIIHALISSLGCCIEYLPPYSPDYNPIEQAFSVINAHLCRNAISFFRSDALYFEMYQACDIITPEMTWGFFAHSGYMV
jgi:transposase